MQNTKGQSSQANQSNHEKKKDAALHLLSEFIESFNDPDPKTNREILSELLTIGLKGNPYPYDTDYSDIAVRLSEAIRSLLNGIIDEGLEGSIQFSYSNLEEKVKLLEKSNSLLEKSNNIQLKLIYLMGKALYKLSPDEKQLKFIEEIKQVLEKEGIDIEAGLE